MRIIDLVLGYTLDMKLDNKSDNIVLIDICGTLFHSNTTFDFLDWMFASNNLYRFFRRCSKLLIWRIINILLFKIFRYDLTRSIAVFFLKNFTKVELSKAALQFYNEWLTLKKHSQIFLIVEKYREQNYKLILVSATLDIIAEVIARKNNFDLYISSKLKYKDNNKTCAGRIETDLLGRKMTVLKELNILPPFFSTITDDTLDIELLKSSQEGHIVINNKNSNKWQRILTQQLEQKCQKIYITHEAK